MQFLIDALQKPIGKIEVEQLASKASVNTFPAKDLIDLSFDKDEQIGFRAAWILERIYSNHLVDFCLFANYFLDKFPQQHNPSALRHYVKILAFMTGKKASTEVRGIIAEYETDSIIESVFGWLIDENIPVAVKSHCLNILANFIPKHQWIKEELIDTMEFLIDKESIAFFAKVKQIRKQIKVKSKKLKV